MRPTIYFSSPCNQMQAHLLADRHVLISYAALRPWVLDYVPTFRGVMIDSGAYSELNSGTAIDLQAYAAWSEQFVEVASAVAGLDDIGGDWKRSLANFAAFPRGFPTFHDTDPPELLDELVAMALERRQWLGVGLKPPRHGKGGWLRRTLERIDGRVHVHGWACVSYLDQHAFSSVDSTTWLRDAMALKSRKLWWVTLAEATNLTLLRYERGRVFKKLQPKGDNHELYGD